MSVNWSEEREAECARQDAERGADTHLARVVEMCGFHQRAIALLAADSLDRDSGVNLAEGFERYDARCEAGDGCGQ